jgi:hypothetical protein
VLVGPTEIRVLSQAADPVPSLEIVQGRLLLIKPAASALNVVASGRAVNLLDMTPVNLIALERGVARANGQPIARMPSLAIVCVQGDAKCSVDNKVVPLEAASIAHFDSTGEIKHATPDSLPSWVTQTEPSAAELKSTVDFVRLFDPARPVLRDIVMATEDDRPEIKQMAIGGLGALGDLSLLLPLLKRERDPVARRAAIAAIRTYMALGSDAAARVRTQLNEELGENSGAVAQRMLVGYSADEAVQGDLYPRLVGLLGSEQESVGIRELALDNLKRLTRRDDLGYDPDHPAGKGLDAWNELLRRNELRSSSARTKTNGK